MPIRVLNVIDNLDQGGVQRYLLNYLENMDRTKVIFDFVVQTDHVGSLEERVLQLGSRVYRAPSFLKDRRGFKDCLSRIIVQGEYSIVEAHQNHRCLLPLEIARRCGVKNRIAHSHSSYPASSFAKQVYRYLFKIRIRHIATHYWGCSQVANEWLYGKTLLSKARVIPNAIDMGRFDYSVDARSLVREAYGMRGLCLGHVGAGGEAKNYPFIVDCFRELKQLDRFAKLLLVGCDESVLLSFLDADDPLFDDIVATGKVVDPERMMSAMDAFVLPSHYEGMPIVVIEAQANGLRPIVNCNAVAKDVDLSGVVRFLPLDLGAKAWAQEIVQQASLGRNCTFDWVSDSSFNIKKAAFDLQTLYESM